MLKRFSFILVVVLFAFLQDKTDKSTKDSKQDKPVVLKVGIEKAAVQEKPSSFSKVIKMLRENDEVTVIEIPEDHIWVKVKAGDKIGYMTKGAIMEEESNVKLTGPVRSKTIRKVSEHGAGKAFSPEVEAKWKKDKNMEKNYETLDNFINNSYPEKFQRSKLIDDISDFIKEGKLE